VKGFIFKLWLCNKWLTSIVWLESFLAKLCYYYPQVSGNFLKKRLLERTMQTKIKPQFMLLLYFNKNPVLSLFFDKEQSYGLR